MTGYKVSLLRFRSMAECHAAAARVRGPQPPLSQSPRFRPSTKGARLL